MGKGDRSFYQGTTVTQESGEREPYFLPSHIFLNSRMKMFSIMKPEGGQRKETLLRMKNGSNFDFESRLADRMSMFSE